VPVSVNMKNSHIIALSGLNLSFLTLTWSAYIFYVMVAERCHFSSHESARI